MDIGYLNSTRYMFGIRYDDLDYFVFIANQTSEIIQTFTNITGRPQLKPRYILGYHQGCFGYQDRVQAEFIVDQYKKHQIPLDGLHLDVDFQYKYRTFTIDDSKFPNPKQFLTNLRKRGVKCSTNITPIIACSPYEEVLSNYITFREGVQKNYFILDKRFRAQDEQSKIYQLYENGVQKFIDFRKEHQQNFNKNFNKALPYEGEVNYGQDKMKPKIDGKPQYILIPGHYPDLSRPQVRQWWGKQYEYIFDQGIQMVWQDMTTPAIRDTRGDMKGFPFRLLLNSNALVQNQTSIQVPAIKCWNQYSYNLHKATYQGLQKLPRRQNKRNFIIGRGSFTGANRYSGLWTGDNASNWDFLKINISQCLSLGLSGVLISGQDIGGFQQAHDKQNWANPQLLIRWTVAGAFLPWFRNHYVRKGRKYFQEPFMYEYWFNQNRNGVIPEPQDLYRAVLPICKHYIQLRYRLLQLFYDLMFKNLTNGLPICRPLFLNFSQDKSLFNDKQQFLSNEFCIGTDLLIAPVLQPRIIQIADSYIDNHGRRDIYLPYPHGWYNFVDNRMPLGKLIEGGTTISDFDADIYTNDQHIPFICPMFVREGGIIPTIQLEQYVGERNQKGLPNPITLNIYPGKFGEYDLFLDDGVSCSSAPQSSNNWDFCAQRSNNEFRHVKVTHNYDSQNPKVRRVKISRMIDNYVPLQDFMYVAIIHDPDQQEINKIELAVTSYNSNEVEKMCINLRNPMCAIQNPESTQSKLKFVNYERNYFERYGKCQEIGKYQKKSQNSKHIVLTKITDGSPEDRARRLSEITSRENAFYYNQNIRVTFIKVWDKKQYKQNIITITYN